MVSLGTLTTLGLIAVAAIAFVGFGGAAGIGARIGGGFKSFSAAITQGIFAGLQNTSTTQMETSEQRILIAQEEFAKTGEPIIAGAFSGFQGVVSQQFAERFSFQPPTTGSTLDVSKSFSYLQKGGITSNELIIAKTIEQNALLYPRFFG